MKNSLLKEVYSHSAPCFIPNIKLSNFIRLKEESLLNNGIQGNSLDMTSVP